MPRRTISKLIDAGLKEVARLTQPHQIFDRVIFPIVIDVVDLHPLCISTPLTNWRALSRKQSLDVPLRVSIDIGRITLTRHSSRMTNAMGLRQLTLVKPAANGGL